MKHKTTKKPKVVLEEKEIIVEVVKEVAAPILKGIELYKALAKAGFPQGGQGNWYAEENGDQKYYIPTPEEIYTQYLADPKDWSNLTDALARVWIENKK